jgi:hypothetical protein
MAGKLADKVAVVTGAITGTELIPASRMFAEKGRLVG